VLVEDLLAFDHAEAASGNPQRALEDRDVKGLVRHGLDQLPRKLREAVVLRDLQGLSYQEMADRLGLPEGTVKSRINRGREELMRRLRKAQQPGRARAALLAARR
jgi:RNA polymerase sigma-70 factor (ECF subfamily)